MPRLERGDCSTQSGETGAGEIEILDRQPVHGLHAGLAHADDAAEVLDEGHVVERELRKGGMTARAGGGQLGLEPRVGSIGHRGGEQADLWSSFARNAATRGPHSICERRYHAGFSVQSEVDRIVCRGVECFDEDSVLAFVDGKVSERARPIGSWPVTKERSAISTPGWLENRGLTFGERR